MPEKRTLTKRERILLWSGGVLILLAAFMGYFWILEHGGIPYITDVKESVPSPTREKERSRDSGDGNAGDHRMRCFGEQPFDDTTSRGPRTGWQFVPILRKITGTGFDGFSFQNVIPFGSGPVFDR